MNKLKKLNKLKYELQAKLAKVNKEIEKEKQKACKHLYNTYFGSHETYEMCIYCNHIKE
jgi:hypothetical protein